MTKGYCNTTFPCFSHHYQVKSDSNKVTDEYKLKKELTPKHVTYFFTNCLLINVNDVRNIDSWPVPDSTN